MKNQRLKLTAIKALLFAALLGFASLSWAQVVGTIAHLSGPLVAKKLNGTVKALAVKSEVENGDTLVAEKNTYAQIKFVDNGEITLRPNTVFKIEKFAYDAAKPDGDAANFDLVKGGLRSVTGLLGKRNKEKFALKTPSATIGIRGTTFIAQYVPPPPAQGGIPISHDPSPLFGGGAQPPAGVDGKAPIDRSPDGNGGTGQAPAGKVAIPPIDRSPDGNGGTGHPPGGKVITPPPSLGPTGPGPAGPPGPPVLAPGLHLQVTDGAIVVTNNGGSLGFQAGQFGYVPNVNQPPVIVPPNTGIQFVPPPSFNPGSGGPTGASGSGQGQATDCIVR